MGPWVGREQWPSAWAEAVAGIPWWWLLVTQDKESALGRTAERVAATGAQPSNRGSGVLSLPVADGQQQRQIYKWHLVVAHPSAREQEQRDWRQAGSSNGKVCSLTGRIWVTGSESFRKFWHTITLFKPLHSEARSTLAGLLEA